MNDPSNAFDRQSSRAQIARALTQLALLTGLTLVVLSTAPASWAARQPTLKEREAVVEALPASIRSTPVRCLWLVIKISSQNTNYAYVGLQYLNVSRTTSPCLRYASNGYFLLKRTQGRWRTILNGSDYPSCARKIPRDLVRCS